MGAFGGVGHFAGAARVHTRSQYVGKAMANDDPAIVLFDFRAAFPSLSIEFLMAAHETIGVP